MNLLNFIFPDLPGNNNCLTALDIIYFEVSWWVHYACQQLDDSKYICREYDSNKLVAELY